jgi:RNA polymerase sigma-70 factor (ECF subfamily)
MTMAAFAAASPISRWNAWPALLRAVAAHWMARLAGVLACAAGYGAEATGVPTEDLIRRFQRGQSRAFEALYDRYKDYVYRVAFFITRHGGDAEEAVQEAFLDVLRALPHYSVEGPARFETWLYRVTVNRCRSRMRRKALPSAEWDEVAEQLERIPSEHPDHDPEGAVVRQEHRAELWQAVDKLPDDQRIVILLRYQQGLAYSEIAQTLGINEGTVKSRLYYAHCRLKQHLAGLEGPMSPGQGG